MEEASVDQVKQFDEVVIMKDVAEMTSVFEQGMLHLFAGVGRYTPEEVTKHSEDVEVMVQALFEALRPFAGDDNRLPLATSAEALAQLTVNLLRKVIAHCEAAYDLEQQASKTTIARPYANGAPMPKRPDKPRRRVMRLPLPPGFDPGIPAGKQFKIALLDLDKPQATVAEYRLERGSLLVRFRGDAREYLFLRVPVGEAQYLEALTHTRMMARYRGIHWYRVEE
jgi:hypothetical protein